MHAPLSINMSHAHLWKHIRKIIFDLKFVFFILFIENDTMRNSQSAYKHNYQEKDIFILSNDVLKEHFIYAWRY